MKECFLNLNKKRFKKLSINVFIIILQISFFNQMCYAQYPNQVKALSKSLRIQGNVQLKCGEPVQGTEIKLGIIQSSEFTVLNFTTTDRNGYYIIETPVRHHEYYLLIQYDDNITAAIDWIPAYYKIEKISTEYNFTTVLHSAATIIFDGPYRSIREYNPRMLFNIQDSKNESILNTGVILQYGSLQFLTEILELNDSTILVPTDTEYQISTNIFKVSSENDVNLNLQQGEIKHLEIQKYSLASDLQVYKDYQEYVHETLLGYQEDGYYQKYEAN